MGDIIKLENYRKSEDEIEEKMIEENDEFYEDELEVICLDDIADVIHSSVPYQEKIELLKNEREKAILLEEYISYTLDNVLKSDKYLKVLKNDLEVVESRMKKDIPIASLTGILSGGSIYYLASHILNNPNIKIEDIPLFAIILASTLLTTLFGYKLKHTIEDFKDKYAYEDAIREYKSILKRRPKKD